MPGPLTPPTGPSIIGRSRPLPAGPGGTKRIRPQSWSHSMPIPNDYAERVYAGVLGKMIGVYLGRPFEGWTYERIVAELGEICYYVNEQRNTPLIVTDDDI